MRAPKQQRAAATEDDPVVATEESSSPEPALLRLRARVPFMITARMRQELTTAELGYDAAQIAGLTPIEAMLILEHRLPSAQVSVKLPALVQAYEREQQQAAAEAAAREAAIMERARRREVVKQQQQEQPPPPKQAEDLRNSQTAEILQSANDDATTADSTTAQSPRTSDAPADPSATTSTSTTRWHQIVRVSSPDKEEEEVVGLFLDRQEAEFARTVHQNLSDERAKRENHAAASDNFEVRTVVKD